METVFNMIIGFVLGVIVVIILFAAVNAPAFESHCSYIGGSVAEQPDGSDICLIDGRVVLTSDEFFEKVD